VIFSARYGDRKNSKGRKNVSFYITDYWFYFHFPICSSARPPHQIQPNGAEKQCLFYLKISVGTDGRTDGQKLSKVATKEKKNSLETVATFSSPIHDFLLPFWNSRLGHSHFFADPMVGLSNAVTDNRISLAGRVRVTRSHCYGPPVVLLVSLGPVGLASVH
jgi:hypothetical protein